MFLIFAALIGLVVSLFAACALLTIARVAAWRSAGITLPARRFAADQKEMAR